MVHKDEDDKGLELKVMVERKFTPREVAVHNTAEDCYIVLNDTVYDLSEYLEKHPGGADTILSWAGADATEEFDSIGHSKDAKKQVESFRVGVLDSHDEGGSDVLNSKTSWNFGLKVTAFEKVNHDSVVIKLGPVADEDVALELATGQHLLVCATINGEKVARPYTPIGMTKDTVTLLVKVYDDGQMSKYLGGVSVGDIVNIRGPSGTFTYNGCGTFAKMDTDLAPVKNLCLVGGGSGITPLWQIAQAILSNANDHTQVSLIYANKAEEDILLKKEIDAAAAKHDNFTVSYTVSTSSDGWEGNVGRITENMLPKSSTVDMVLLCGPSGMLTACKTMCINNGFSKKTIHVFDAPVRKTVGKVDTTGNPLLNLWNWNKYLVFMITSAMFVCMVALTNGTKGDGYGGRFDIVGFDANVVAYAYKLKNPKLINAVVPWTGYLLHNFSIWGILYKAMNEKPEYTNHLQWFNKWMLAVNGFFIILKYSTSLMFYNGLSATLSLGWGIATVGVMLMMVLAMYTNSRGMCFGRCKGGAKTNEAARFLRKYHGVFISFALINDFWFHPFEGTAGHLLGIMNDCMLMWQMSMIYNRAHRNKWWCLALEIMVLPHSAIIALNRSNDLNRPQISGMFGFAYCLILVCTQMHGVDISKAGKWALALLFVVSCTATYGLGGLRGKELKDIHEITRIPTMSYMVAGYFLLSYTMFAPCIKKIGNTMVQSVMVGAICFMVLAVAFVPFLLLF